MMWFVEFMTNAYAIADDAHVVCFYAFFLNCKWCYVWLRSA